MFKPFSYTDKEFCPGCRDDLLRWFESAVTRESRFYGARVPWPVVARAVCTWGERFRNMFHFKILGCAPSFVQNGWSEFHKDRTPVWKGEIWIEHDVGVSRRKRFSPRYLLRCYQLSTVSALWRLKPRDASMLASATSLLSWQVLLFRGKPAARRVYLK